MVALAQYFFYFLLHPLFIVFFRPKITGLEQMPSRPFIVAANHTAMIDPFLLSLLPFSAVRKIIPIYFLTTERYYRKWYLYPLIKMLGSYPVSRKAWTFEEFLSSSVRKLRAGRVIMFFPEGKISRGGQREKPRPGVGYLIEKSGCAVFPLHIQWEGNRILQRKKLTLAFGRPISIPAESAGKRFYEKNSELIMNTVYSL
jgi:1-acyl-sn-glycerol-3-phosphate acyltransferase